MTGPGEKGEPRGERDVRTLSGSLGHPETHTLPLWRRFHQVPWKGTRKGIPKGKVEIRGLAPRKKSGEVATDVSTILRPARKHFLFGLDRDRVSDQLPRLLPGAVRAALGQEDFPGLWVSCEGTWTVCLRNAKFQCKLRVCDLLVRGEKLIFVTIPKCHRLPPSLALWSQSWL